MQALIANFIIFVMFFVSPPAKPGKQVWALSSTSYFEFGSMDACKKFGTHLQSVLATTGTVTMRGWCVNSVTGESTYDEMAAPANPKTYCNSADCFEIPVGKGK